MMDESITTFADLAESDVRSAFEAEDYVAGDEIVTTVLLSLRLGKPLLLEVLSDFQVSIPELGTVAADRPPIVIVTSNRTRALSDALKRRCLYLYVEPPSVEKETAILRRKGRS